MPSIWLQIANPGSAQQSLISISPQWAWPRSETAMKNWEAEKNHVKFRTKLRVATWLCSSSSPLLLKLLLVSLFRGYKLPASLLELYWVVWRGQQAWWSDAWSWPHSCLSLDDRTVFEEAVGTARFKCHLQQPIFLLISAKQERCSQCWQMATLVEP